MTKTTKTLPVFNNTEDYSQASPERTCKYKLEDGQVIYLTEEQRNFMVQEYWTDKLQKFRQNRCAIRSKSGRLKRCPAERDCSVCPHYLNGKKRSMVIFLDAMRQDGEMDLQDTDADVESIIIKKEQSQLISKLIENISDTVDRTIITRWVYNQSTDASTAKILGLSVRAVTKRRNKVFNQLKKALEKIF